MRDDLGSRVVNITLEPIHERRPEAELFAACEETNTTRGRARESFMSYSDAGVLPRRSAAMRSLLVLPLSAPEFTSVPTESSVERAAAPNNSFQ